MTITVTTAEQLEQLAKDIGAASAPSSTLNSRLLKLVREPALAYFGITLPSTAATYTAHFETALKLRPPGFLLSIQDLDARVRGTPPVVGGLSKMGAPGTIIGGSSGMGATLALCLCATIAHTWANEIRRQLGLIA